MKHLKNQRGQGLVEYMVIVALMAVATMSIMRLLSQTTSGKLAQITKALNGGRGVNVEIEAVEQSHFKKKDMQDFFQGANRRRSNRRNR